MRVRAWLVIFLRPVYAALKVRLDRAAHASGCDR
jgi:hypothetical protein